jgi:hypothetical protein
MGQDTCFTPGPWRVVIDDDGNPLSGRPSVVASDEFDCGIVHWDGFVQTYWRSARGDKEIHANAHVISASPDMYEALEAAIEQVRAELNYLIEQGPPKEWKGDVYRLSLIVNSGDAALAKARGEQ